MVLAEQLRGFSTRQDVRRGPRTSETARAPHSCFRGGKGLRAGFWLVVFFFKVRGQEMLMGREETCALDQNFIQTDPV